MRLGLTGGVLGAMIGAAALTAPAAHAQRVISDYEASKLTLDALTSVPVVHHVTYHRVTRVASRHGVSSHEAVISRHALIHQVAYHPHAAVRTVAVHRASHRHHT
ncbi:hypothetical protein [Tanticharoenia sakaeratensis]|jgi:hypothetical protein|uniref:Uncharacterized protein n=1 Tax=Tanticharoenia sakaeratensis NBRC 103193 TaxID=1231623 RepID=A0A0D6MIC9_9PROT|nr:hypothetical protein [Tanticharoenia sakaeratensis]GAN53372.1 hypothetical protein Tasa_009_167 [Tanticharoenia sakaeratensis NBRC 103193]GBQ20839.1 hypothetical protein AA103193_1521 [Tanticharoenia sakaeratensis NBRC 103193]